jgi:hypothetical protein
LRKDALLFLEEQVKSEGSNDGVKEMEEGEADQ